MLLKLSNFFVLITCNSIVFSELVFLAEWWSGTDVVLYIDKEDFKKYYGKEHGYLLMNHCYEVDWLLGWIVSERIGVLGVSCID